MAQMSIFYPKLQQCAICIPVAKSFFSHSGKICIRNHFSTKTANDIFLDFFRQVLKANNSHLVGFLK